MSKKLFKKRNKRLLGTKLGARLIAYVFCSLCLSIVLFYLLYLLSFWCVQNYSRTLYLENKLNEFGEYVETEQIKYNDFSSLTAWLNKNDIKFMHIWRGDQRVFNSDDPVDDDYVYDEREREYHWGNRFIAFINEIELIPNEEVDKQTGADSFNGDAGDSDGETDITENLDDENLPYVPPVDNGDISEREDTILRIDDEYSQRISYKTLNVYIAVDDDVRLLIVLIIASVVISLLVFAFFTLMLVSTRFRYLVELEGEVAEIEGGMIDRRVTVKGDDEIALLARSIEDMRMSMVMRLESEKEAYDANKELITAMSHDLRTPLSALIGYLEIVDAGVYSSDEQKDQYIKKSVEKAYQLKAMSDKLFDYFTVFKNEGTEELKTEVYDGYELLSQMIGEQSYMLEEQGYSIEYAGMDDPGASPFGLQVDSGALLRVFDNIYSNILKYADKSAPVRISMQVDDYNVRVTVSNKVNKKAVKVASTKIGLKSCRRLLSRMNGTLKSQTNGEEYSVTVAFKKYIEDNE
ncbi:MAG: HAMP domain-containing histidine kinase [Clostridia bacterium]|nr:HAMP domain-containing histidine kinase [Clostridia bacterium]